MPQLRGRELSELYPQPKTYDELRAEKARREQARRPRFVAVKIGAYSTLGLLTLFVAYRLAAHLMVTSLSAEGGLSGASLAVLFNVAFATLVCLFALALLYYYYSLIDALATKVLHLKTWLYMGLSVVLGAGIAALAAFGQNEESSGLVMVATSSATLLLSFLLASGLASLAIKRQD